MDNFEAFSNQQYLNIETYRKSGQPVATPVWFVQERDTLYIHTLETAGKYKRIRNNPQVRIMPCGARGEPKGEWMSASAQAMPAEEKDRINRLFRQKYGLQKRFFEMLNLFRGGNYVMIAIHPSTSA